MSDDPRVEQLLDELCDSHATPEDVCGSCPDLLPVVRERYAVPPGKRDFTCLVEIFSTTRPARSVRAGNRLRVVDTERFRVVYTFDNWRTTLTKESKPVGYAGFFVDLPTTPEQEGKITLTLYWPGEDRWLGRNADVEVLGSA